MLVKTFRYPCGTAEIHDDAYANASPQEIQERIDRMNRVAYQFYMKVTQQQAAREQAEQTE